jgi:hypothetical protein
VKRASNETSYCVFFPSSCLLIVKNVRNEFIVWPGTGAIVTGTGCQVSTKQLCDIHLYERRLLSGFRSSKVQQIYFCSNSTLITPRTLPDKLFCIGHRYTDTDITVIMNYGNQSVFKYRLNPFARGLISGSEIRTYHLLDGKL